MKVTLENGQVIEISDKSYKELAKHANGRWRADDMGNYWIVNDWGENIRAEEETTEIDDYRYNIGNHFKTEEEAEHRRGVLLATQKIKDFANFKPDWSEDSEKYLIHYNHSGSSFYVSSYAHLQGIGQIHFATGERAEQCIKELEKELKLILGVK